MRPIQFQILDPMIEAAAGPKGRKTLWNVSLEEYFSEINRMVYDDTLLDYPYRIIISI